MSEFREGARFIAALMERSSRDLAYTTNSLMHGYEAQIQQMAKALQELYDLTLSDPNLTVRNQKRAMSIAGGIIHTVDDILDRGYYVDSNFVDGETHIAK